MVRTAVVFVVFALFAAMPVTAQSPVGVYTVAGTNPDGDTYEGVAEITEQDGRLMVSWELKAGDTADGFAFVDGDSFTYICRAVAPNGDTAFAYGHCAKSGGTWSCKWSSPGQLEPGREVLTPSTKSLERLKKELHAAPGLAL